MLEINKYCYKCNAEIDLYNYIYTNIDYYYYYVYSFYYYHENLNNFYYYYNSDYIYYKYLLNHVIPNINYNELSKQIEYLLKLWKRKEVNFICCICYDHCCGPFPTDDPFRKIEDNSDFEELK